ncbi:MULTISPECIES: hypothetical protein [Asticcacaulis]|uniref:hypothetical protein n=1 Tax=Asticcacaulis TaxID=76890 RepID=UPI001AE751CF|nr:MULTISPECIES: hypothetical protein [Asticcacaulis]MBP2158762.1 hypothetical protein [Asticcacaulis solisilvae]MDR6799808.1 hypothetical protein [Asticcacaulis sp. BE141]
MQGKTLKDNDALRFEFIRSVIRNVSDDRDNGFVQTVLFTFIKGSARSPLVPGDEAVLHAYLRDVIDACLKPDTDGEALIHELAALAKHVADTEAAPVAAFVAALRDNPEKVAVNGAS